MAEVKWISDLQGMINRQDYDKLPDNYSPFLLNISNDKPGTWSKRKGSVILGESLAGDGIMGAGNYEKNDETNTLRIVRGQQLYTYNEDDDLMELSIASGFPTTRVEHTNFLNRNYWVGNDLFLSYEEGSGTLTTVSSSDNRIKGKCIASAQRTLYVGNITNAAGSAQNWQDRVYFSEFDTDNNTPSHQLWATDESSLATSTNFFTAGAPVKAIHAYNNALIVFTRKKGYMFDMQYRESGTALREIFPGIGCANQRAVTVCNDWLVWMDCQGRIWAWGGAGRPMELSWEIEDDENGLAIINKISKTNLASVCAGSKGNKFYFSIGDITWYGTSYTNVVIRGMLTSSMDNVLWGIETYPYKPSIFVSTEIDSEDVLTMACTNNNAYLMNIGANDNGTAIDAKGWLKFFDFGNPVATTPSSKLWVKYKPQSVDNTYIKIKYAIDGSVNFTAITDPDGGESDYGTIDMYHADNATKLNDVKFVNMPKGLVHRNLTLEIGNSQTGESFEVSGIGIQTDRAKELDIRVE